MKKNESNKLVTIGLTTSIVLSSFSDALLVVNAKEINSSYNTLNSKTTNIANQEQIYLSDLNYEADKSRPGWGGIRNDRNPDGGKITLIVDDEVTEFERGIGAHATSTVVYDISRYTNEYTRFVSYIGVDYSQVNKGGDGVKFIISTSNDGVTWTEVENLGIVLPEEGSRYVDIELNGAKYIKFYADEHKGNGNDHSVYADAKLVKDDYIVSNIKVEGLHPVSYYDEILREKTIEENIEKNEMLILQRAFVDRVTYHSIERLLNKGEKYVNGIEYIFNDKTALKYFITNGPVNKGGSYLKSLMTFCDIYEIYKDDLKNTQDNNFNLRLAISIALGFSRDAMVEFWAPRYEKVDAVKRYELYQELISSGRMDAGGNQDGWGKWSSEQFKELPIPMMKWVVDARINNSEILWLADYALSEKDKGRDYLDGYNYIDYDYTFGYNYDNPKYYDEANHEKYNNKYNFDSYFDDYGNPDINRMWMVFEEGAVCGGISHTYANTAEVFGRPASPAGQPGHAVSITWAWHNENQRYEWMLSNDISGWVETGNQFDDRLLGWGTDWNDWFNASYTILATDAIYDSENYMKTTMLNLLADSYSDNNTKKEAYKKALTYQNINYDSIIGLINCYKADNNTTSTDYYNLAKEIIKNFTYYPQVMMDLLVKIEDKLETSNELASIDLLKNEALVKSSTATTEQSSNVNACKQLANHYLKNNESSLASFSFNGENANKIVLDSRYTDSTVRIRYSLDGGDTWTQTNEKIIELTESEVASINADDDIIIGLVGTEATHTIDILPGKTITPSVVYANDNENVLIGELEGLEFSLDDGQTWCGYVIENNSSSRNSSYETDSKGRIKFNGDKSVKIRYKAKGTMLQSDEVVYNFTENKDAENRKYIPIKNISLEGCSQPNADDTKGEHLLDGTPNTQYHTTYNVNTPDKFFTVKFDKVRYITSMEYHSNSYNGKFQTGKILTSLDGVNWTESGSFRDLGWNHTVKTMDLNEPTPARYLKLVHDETYGQIEDYKNMFLSGNMLNFFEDATKEYIAEPTIKYSTDALTNEDVTATITLPEGCKMIGEDTYVFTNNGRHTFRYIDASDVERSVEAIVDWIDKEAPTADVVYSTQSPTNGDVIVTLTNISDDARVINNDNKTTYTFTENDTFEFILEDRAGNRTVIPVTVNWINKENPTISILYSEQDKTNQDVTVTLIGLKEGEYVENNDGEISYTFKENGEFEFIVKNEAGNTTIVPVSVNWIDKVVPTANIVYDIDTWTRENVTARLTDISEEVTILNDDGIALFNTSGGLDYHVFEDNGSYTFRFRDEAGNIGTATATVNWIDKTKPEQVTIVEKKEENGNEIAVVSLNIDLNEVEVLNNGGSPEYTFTKNETFTFKLRLRSTGYEFEVPVTVDWLNKDTNDDIVIKPEDKPENKPEDKPNEKPVEKPIDKPNTDNSANSGNNESNNSSGNNNNNNNNENNNENDNKNLNDNINSDKPQTGDNMLNYIINTAISASGLIILNRRKKIRQNKK